uniref:Leukocyte receptor cluster member 4 n=1 Tax=Phallusia mammillata TaxID=59560 RepID=A0A6F9DKE8_9ASCI|nr:lysophospholipid acyltransferase 7 [Phallusia mammillata]
MDDNIVYTFVLVFTILIGFPLRSLSTYKWKQVATGGIGFGIVLAICGNDIFYSLITILGNLLIIKLTSKNTSFISFAWCFLFLLFFRCATFFNLPKPSPLANAVQLLLTLKLVSVAIEIRDYRVKKATSKKSDDNEVQSKFQLELMSEPTMFEIMCFSYCYAGLFTGPMFKYRTYHDFLLMSPAEMKKVPWRSEIMSRLKQVALFAPLYLATAFFFTIDYPKTDEFYDEPHWYRVFYMVPIFFMGRMRFYTAWLLAECAFVTLTLGAYPKDLSPRPGHGPTIDPASKSRDSSEKIEYGFETIRNINPYGCDFTPTVRLGMRNWNMTVQWWLANYVHRRWPNSLKQFKIAGVMAVSAYWHGIDPGFFGAFLTMIFVMMAEDLLKIVVKNRLPASLHSAYDWVNWFAKMRSFEYMYMAFTLLTRHDTYRYWKSVYFWLHITAFALIGICTLIRTVLRSPRKSDAPREGKVDKKD